MKEKKVKSEVQEYKKENQDPESAKDSVRAALGIDGPVTAEVQSMSLANANS